MCWIIIDCTLCCVKVPLFDSRHEAIQQSAFIAATPLMLALCISALNRNVRCINKG